MKQTKQNNISNDNNKLSSETINTLREYDLYLARNSMLGFTCFTYPEFQANWHHKLICQTLDDFFDRKFDRLIVNMPPQHGKTELVSRRFCAYLLGRNPDERIIATSFSSTMAESNSRDVQRIIDAEEYQTLFPKTQLNNRNVRKNALGNYIRTSELFEIVGYKGYYKCAGVGGAINGKSASILLLDDPYANFMSANSDTIRNNIWEWFTSTFLTRRAVSHLRVLIIQTRWHEDDISGRLLNTEGDKWKVLTLPAIAEVDSMPYDIRLPGQALWEQRHSLELLLETQQRNGSIVWNSVYQQRPSPQGSGLFKRENFRYADLHNNIYTLFDGDNLRYINTSDCFRFVCCDLNVVAKKTSDYTVITVFDLTKEHDLIIRHVFREQMDGAEHINVLWSLHRTYKLKEICIEATQYQSTLIQTALKQGLPAKPLRADTDKKLRALPAATKFESHKIFFLTTLPNLDDLETELLQFPQGKYDDFVDTLGYAAARAYNIAEVNYIPTRLLNNKPAIAPRNEKLKILATL